MSYEIDWSSQSLRAINKLPMKDAERILNKLDDVAGNPFRYLEHYEGEDFYKLRIGNYRVLIDVDFTKRVLLIEVLDKRGRIYKR